MSSTIDRGGVLPTYWSSKVTRERLGRHDSYWVEFPDAYTDLEMIETKIDFSDADGMYEMGVVIRAREGCVAVLRPEDEL